MPSAESCVLLMYKLGAAVLGWRRASRRSCDSGDSSRQVLKGRGEGGRFMVMEVDLTPEESLREECGDTDNECCVYELCL